MPTLTKSSFITCDASEAVASVAYRLNELIAIYPITPSSNMAEVCDEWAALKKPNLWGEVPRVVEMQSEAGVSGTVHGGLLGGALTTTFTASRGCSDDPKSLQDRGRVAAVHDARQRPRLGGAGVVHLR